MRSVFLELDTNSLSDIYMTLLSRPPEFTLGLTSQTIIQFKAHIPPKTAFALATKPGKIDKQHENRHAQRNPMQKLPNTTIFLRLTLFFLLGPQRFALVQRGFLDTIMLVSKKYQEMLTLGVVPNVSPQHVLVLRSGGI